MVQEEGLVLEVEVVLGDVDHGLEVDLTPIHEGESDQDPVLAALTITDAKGIRTTSVYLVFRYFIYM